jgi:hypothetical protein
VGQHLTFAREFGFKMLNWYWASSFPSIGILNFWSCCLPNLAKSFEKGFEEMLFKLLKTTTFLQIFSHLSAQNWG